MSKYISLRPRIFPLCTVWNLSFKVFNDESASTCSISLSLCGCTHSSFQLSTCADQKFFDKYVFSPSIPFKVFTRFLRDLLFTEQLLCLQFN